MIEISCKLTWRKISRYKSFAIPEERQPCVLSEVQKHPIIFDVVTTNGLQAAQFRARIGWPAHVSRRKHDSVGARNFRRSGTGCYSTFCREKSDGEAGGKWAVLPSGRKQDDVLRAEREAPGCSATADFLGRKPRFQAEVFKIREVSFDGTRRYNSSTATRIMQSF